MYRAVKNRLEEESRLTKDNGTFLTVLGVNQESTVIPFVSGYNNAVHVSLPTSESEQEIFDGNGQENVEGALEFDRELKRTGVNRSFQIDDDDLEVLDTMISPSTRTTGPEEQQPDSGLHPNLVFNPSEADDVPGDESLIWGLTLESLNSGEGDPRQILTIDPNGSSPTGDSESASDVVADDVEPLFPLNVAELNREDKDYILGYVLYRAFHDFSLFELNIRPQIFGESAIKLAIELGINNFKFPGSKWIHTWKSSFFPDPSVFSYGWQVGRIVDTKKGNKLLRIAYLTGKRLGRTRSQETRNCRLQPNSSILKMPFLKDWIGTPFTKIQVEGNLLSSVVFMNHCLNNKTQKLKRSKSSLFGSALPMSPAAPGIILASSSPSSKKSRRGKCMETIISYNEAVEANGTSFASIVPPPEQQSNPTSTGERMESVSDLELQDDPFDTGCGDPILDEELNILFDTSGSVDLVPDTSILYNSDSENDEIMPD